MPCQKHEIREALRDLEAARKKILQPKFLTMGLTLGEGQPRILNALLLKDDTTQRELADACRMDVTTLSRALDRMETEGWLKRTPDQSSRRSFRIMLTEAGRKKALLVQEAFQAVDDQICLNFTQWELDALLLSLQKINTNLAVE